MKVFLVVQTIFTLSFFIALFSYLCNACTIPYSHQGVEALDLPRIKVSLHFGAGISDCMPNYCNFLQ